MKPKLLIVTYVNLPKYKIKFKEKYSELDRILNETCTFFKISKKEIMSKNRERKIIDPKAIFFAFCYDFTEYSLAKIGEQLNMNHASVLYGKDKSLFVLKKEYKRFKIYMQNCGFVTEKSRKIYTNPENIYRNGKRKKN